MAARCCTIFVIGLATEASHEELHTRKYFDAALGASILNASSFRQFRDSHAYHSVVGGYSYKIGCYLLGCFLSTWPDMLGIQPLDLWNFFLALRSTDKRIGGARQHRCYFLPHLYHSQLDWQGMPGHWPVSMNVHPDLPRYLRQRLQLHAVFGDLAGMRVTEIGGGYGGLGVVLLRNAPGWRGVRHHQVLDAPEACALIHRVSRLTSSNKLLGCTDWSGGGAVQREREAYHQHASGHTQIDLIVSFFAISELPSHVVDEYIVNYVAHARRGFFQLNYATLRCHNLTQRSLRMLTQSRRPWVVQRTSSQARVKTKTSAVWARSKRTTKNALLEVENADDYDLSRYPGRYSIQQLFERVSALHADAELRLPEPCRTCWRQTDCLAIAGIDCSGPMIVWGHIA